MNYRLLSLFCSVLIFSAACSSNRVELERDHKYQVRVRTSTGEVKSFENQLVHRISVSKSELSQFFSSPEGRKLPFQVVAEADREGRVFGCRVQYPSDSFVLGLQQNDIITAIGKTRVTEAEHIWLLYDELIENRQSTLTLKRAGSPHKILYYLDS